MIDKLIEEAAAASTNAIATRSGIKVGCAIELVSGEIYTGWNIEGSWQTSIHAEVSAISRMKRKNGFKIKKIAIFAKDVDFTPCGACLDWLLAFSTDETKLITSDSIAEAEYLLKDLYPCYPKK